MAVVLNRWNKKWYTVLEADSKSVTLQREDKSTFKIERKELFANYVNILFNKELENLLKSTKNS